MVAIIDLNVLLSNWEIIAIFTRVHLGWFVAVIVMIIIITKLSLHST